jgi:hypothetical protein
MAWTRTTYEHCPPDIIAAIDKYDADVKAGRIKFDGEFASNYPGKNATDEQIRQFLGDHIAD